MARQQLRKATFTLPAGKAHAVAAALSELLWPPPDVVGLFDNEDGTWRVEATFGESPKRKALEDFLSAHGAENIELTFEDIPDADWVAVSQAGLHPVREGVFLVHGSHDRRLAHACRHAIEIDAAQAFGTAHHGSTRGCLRAISDLSKRGRYLRALDIGTGTGVLAIAVAHALSAQVLATDIDPVAVAITRENAARNGVQAQVRAVAAEGLNHPLIRVWVPCDLVIANILARPLIAMAHGIARALRPGGVVILSGITNEQAGRVVAAFGAAGFARLRRYSVSGWVTLALRRQARRRRRMSAGE